MGYYYDDDFDPIEDLKEIKKQENEFLQNLIKTGRLESYILWLHNKILQDYPEMVIDVISDEDINKNDFER